MTCSADPGTTAESQLRALVERGFRFLHHTSADGNVLAVVGVRAHDSVVDVIWLHGESDARAVRMAGDEPDVLAPASTMWESAGPAGPVLTELLSLPDDRLPGAPESLPAKQNRSGGCWIPVRSGTSRWVAATA